MLPYLNALFVLFWQWNNQWCWRPVFWGRRLKKVVNFLRKKCTPEKTLVTPLTLGDLAWGFSDLEMTWLLYCAGAATAHNGDTANVGCHVTQRWPTCNTQSHVAATDLYIYILDAVPPTHIVWNHVATDKLTTANGGTFTPSSASLSSQSR